MLSDEPIDEDLEALLYAQVYYGKEQEVELPSLTETEGAYLNKDETGSDKQVYKKKRYFDCALTQKDKEKKNRDSLVKDTNTEPRIDENLISESHSVINTNTVKDIFETSLQDRTTPPERNQNLELETISNQQHQFIQISTTSPSANPSSKEPTEIVTTALLSTPTEPSQPHLLNNITINQYLFPSDFEQRLRSSLQNIPLSKKCKSDLNKLKRGNISEQQFFNNLRRRLKIQKKQQTGIRKAYFEKQQRIAQSEVICLSDSDTDTSDLEIVEVTNLSEVGNKKPLNMKDKVEVLQNSDHEADADDEIIYIAPPPVPVISIDTESDSDDLEVSDKDKEDSENLVAYQQESNNIQNIPTIQLENDETSDDFLQPKNTPDNFNFSLHGSDFQDSEFIRPANPMDSYETESSTSTSDFNRDSTRQFCNTVKTIVFNEVEFPNQDIFDGNNLESFGEFITPRREERELSNKATSESMDKSGDPKASKRVNLRTSSESSSESEYEGPNTHKNLPDLSPMVCAESTPKKIKISEQLKKKKGKLDVVENKTRSSKKKSKGKLSDKNDSIVDFKEQVVAEEPVPVRKSKRKNCETVEEGEVIPRKKSKKKKNKSGNKNTEESEGILETSTIVSDKNVSGASPKKNSKVNKGITNSIPSESIIEDEPTASSFVDDSSKKKKKKKKKHSKNKDDLENNESVIFVDQQDKRQQVLSMGKKGDDVEDISKKKGKKKKVKEPSLSKNLDDAFQTQIQMIIDNQRKTLEKDNQTLANEQDGNLEECGKKKNKRRKQKETSEIIDVSEASTVTNDENQLSKRTGSEGESILNKSSEEQGQNQQDILAEDNIVLEQNNDCSSSSSSGGKKKNKRKKRTSTDKRSSVEEEVPKIQNENIEASDNGNNQDLEEGEIIDEPEGEEKSGENVVANSETQEEDIILIEQVIPVHTIESSESDEDIITFDNVGDDLELANISETIGVDAEVINNKDFDVDYVKSKMSDDPDKWKILSSDRYNLNISKKGPRCNKCRHFGHISIHCPNKPPLPVCTLCGETGHQEPRCPNKVCFTCGKPGSYSTIYCYMCVKQRKDKCTLCSIIGHRAEFCPDLWRRYFLTTKEGPLTEAKKNGSALKPRNKQWCSGCASSGHLEFECNTYKWMREYPTSSPYIFKYHDVYQAKKKVPCPPEVDRQRKYYERFVAKALQFPTQAGARQQQGTSRQRSVARHSDVYDKNLKDSNPQASAPVTKENPQISEKTVESLDDRNGNQMETQQIIESQDNNPGNQVVFPEPFTQSIPTMVFRQRQISKNTNQPRTPQGRRRRKSRKNLSEKTRINPVSVIRPTGYTPYQSVLNPYSILAAAPTRPQQQGLFNQVPNDILAQQLQNLASAVATYQNSRNQHGYGFTENQLNFYQFQQCGAQIPPNCNPLFNTSSNTYPNFSQPNPELYYDIQNPPNSYGNRDFLERPHTITRGPMVPFPEEILDFSPPDNQMGEAQLFMEDRERQTSLQHRLEEDYRRRRNNERDMYVSGFRNSLTRPTEPRPDFISLDSPLEQQVNHYGMEDEMPRPSDIRMHDNFISTNTPVQESLPSLLPVFNKTSKCVNVDESTMKKFNTGSTEQLRELIGKELDKLDNIRQTDAKIYKKKLNTLDQLKRIEVKTNSIKKQMYFLFKQINMFLFGVRKLLQGNKNLGFLRNFVCKHDGACADDKRKNLLQAYGYIFGGEHPDFNYRRYLNSI